MSKTAALTEGDLDFAQGLFADHFDAEPPIPPAAVEKREFAFSLFGGDGAGPFARHRSFSSTPALLDEIKRLSPRHTYYSTAFYEHPGHLSMKEKNWEGAEVIFDLDADHLRNAEGLSYVRQLELAKQRFLFLLDEFLFRDFGLDEASVQIVFSGGRGYHAHVLAPAFERLTSMERRELVDYIMGVGFEPEKDSFETDTEQIPHAGAKKYRRLATSEEAGWKGRMAREVLRWVRSRKDLTEEAMAVQVLDVLGELRVEAKRGLARRARTIAKQLVDPETQRAILERGALENFGSDENRDFFLEAISRRLAIPLQGETDAPVTTDVHRLIRMPGSLHGGTGFVVRPIERRELDRFDPFRDALLSQGSARSQTVELLQDVDYSEGNPSLLGKAGARLTLTEPLALFLVLRGDGTVVR
ncbi:MAG: DNA primase catalytic subunit PriS [Candidatus Thermoplasmatota archaeon]|jgi:DNA primase small subunit|nr:DNA primase catalytic subunit PriS [Candidatus Thermoplasmatota archaeon]MCL5984741.1 DNA primase catalytic subunit PriS [Candidatus Thermoplasmatota archaeon]